MNNTKLTSLLIGGIAIIGLSGCEQLEQAATEAVENARQTAVQTLDEASRAGSVEEAKQTAGNALQDIRQQASGLLRQASDYLSGQQPMQNDTQPVTNEAAVNETETGG